MKFPTCNSLIRVAEYGQIITAHNGTVLSGLDPFGNIPIGVAAVVFQWFLQFFVRFVDLAAANFRLADKSPYRNAATDGRDLGADIDSVRAAGNVELTTQSPQLGGRN